MNIPTMSRASFKNGEREVGSIIEGVAKKSCEDVAIKEKNSAILMGAEPDENDLIPISVSYDMGWQKRGKGFNSNTGQGAVMGLDTGKIIDYTTKTKTCRICEHAAKSHEQPRHHDCRKNHTGSSKSMEPLSAVDLFQNATNYNIKYSKYTGDDDSTTECYVHEKVPYGIEKYSDIIHIKRSLTTRLYNLSKQFVSIKEKVILNPSKPS
ncbi:uncharacterized protein LOC114540689 [Dendronephthya gigantea]|uniref:uncharacterized protein LOC114540689 n=1 Tax=Dendronephthya gigantea TaxID=151771 RepID=UPI00106CCAFF|nr:uncharacterized protein LOC114540689 [Dendronephthya gigantea]